MVRQRCERCDRCRPGPGCRAVSQYVYVLETSRDKPSAEAVPAGAADLNSLFPTSTGAFGVTRPGSRQCGRTDTASP
jgi:hypothetical protein